MTKVVMAVRIQERSWGYVSRHLYGATKYSHVTLRLCSLTPQPT